MIGNPTTRAPNLFLAIFRLLDLFAASLLLLDNTVANQAILGLVLLGGFC